MTNVETIISKFVTDLQAAIRQSALEAATAALSGTPAAVVTETATATNATPAKAPKAGKAAAKAPKAKAAKKAPGQKRDPAELEKLVESLHAQIKKDAGQGIEAISKAMGVVTKDLSLPIKKLLGAKRITSKGQKRATRYFAKG